MSGEPEQTPQASSDAGTAVFQKLESYSWDTDAEFQSGLTAILGPEPATLSESRLHDLTLHARCFYFSRTAPQPVPSGPAGGVPSEPPHSDEPEAKSLSFAEVMELVQSGQSIPGVKDIPDTVLEGAGTESSNPGRQKPWEKATRQSPGLFDNRGA
ncbi:hypothetical protein FH972_022498 [Carpinus fangiana]|uniref:Uncharacterized protein n=1 Tax=Carpinus fangiana TaxID=176857 RepID=A0A5N6KSZ3_9ROSI|nr:hypothetical protein FH972_022498 [Carpinus fangiana]